MNVSNLANLFQQNGIFQQNRPLGQKLGQPPVNDTLQRLSEHLLTAQERSQDLKKRFDTLELSAEAAAGRENSALSEMPTELLEVYFHMYQFEAKASQWCETDLTCYRDQLSAFDQTIQEYQDMLDGKRELPQTLSMEDIAGLLEQTRAAREQYLRQGAEQLNQMGSRGLSLSKNAYQLLEDPESARNSDFKWSIDPSAGDIYGEIDRALDTVHGAGSLSREGASRILAELKRRGGGDQPWHQLPDSQEGSAKSSAMLQDLRAELWNTLRRGEFQGSSGQMKPIASTPYTRVPPDSRLQAELLPPSEQGSYTEEDALLNQYMKQYRIDGYFDGDTFVSTSSEPVRVMLKDNISKEDLEKFRSELAENGLGDEIDWRGVESDFVQICVNFGNVERFEQKADYLASRYAVLKDRIQTQFTGDKQEAELQKLEQIYTKAKEAMANTYAEKIGGFFEDLGQSGAAEDMRSSVLALVDQKANAYTDCIEKNRDYANITDPDKQWLKQDDGYMAAQLRQSAAASQAEPQEQPVKEQAPYDGNDLSFAGIYAKTLSQQLGNPTWKVYESDKALGQHLAAQFHELKDSAAKAGVSDRLSNLLTASFSPFMDRLMDSLDALIDQNRRWVAEKPWMAGTIRTNYIDRESVYRAFQSAAAKA